MDGIADSKTFLKTLLCRAFCLFADFFHEIFQKSSLYRAGGEARDEVFGKEQVQHDNRQRRKREQREHARPIGGILPLQAGDSVKQRFVRFIGGNEYEREPQIVPDGNEVVDGDRGKRRTDEWHHDGKIDFPAACAVDMRRLVKILGKAVDELGQDEHRNGQPHGDIHRRQAPAIVQKPENLHQFHQADGRYLDGQHHAHDKEEINALGQAAAPMRQAVAGERSQKQNAEERTDDHDQRVCKIHEKFAFYDDVAEIFKGPDSWKAERICHDIAQRFKRIDHQQKAGKQGDDGP